MAKSPGAALVHALASTINRRSDAPKEWEARRALRRGSESVGMFRSRRGAEGFARKDIKANGSVGRISHIDKKRLVVYYDVHEEMT